MLSMGSNEFGFKSPIRSSAFLAVLFARVLLVLVFLLALLLSLHPFQIELYGIDDVKKLLIEMLGVLIAIILERFFCVFVSIEMLLGHMIRPTHEMLGHMIRPTH